MTIDTQTAYSILSKYEKLGKLGTKSTLLLVPKAERRYKCHTCYGLGDAPDGICPDCGEPNLVIMCPLDHCHCSHDIIAKIMYCPLCGEPICPECGSHDVEPISRVTGYLQATSGWNAGKQQELKDRSRYDAMTGLRVHDNRAE